ncbi:ISAs1 family transposase [Micromonospora sp. NBC_01638]|uniref:ISAs1 family transposase n=1 Tax=Micromonospora sp. NBC_01638 TaxID=2975982 RepID=UPI0038638927|nr:ISAs1 family transposase [Micromonospora sp. NBC_01638]
MIAQLRVPDDTTEVTQVQTLLDPVEIAGTVITADAAHPSTETADYLHQRGAGYVFTVKGNRPTLLAAIWQRLPAATSDTAAHTHREHHSGLIIERRIWTADAAGIDFPAAAQVFRIRRDTYDLTGQRLRKDIVHGITNLTAQAATPADVADYTRRHWGIENKIHWVRDVLFAEDHHHAWLGTVAHTMALFRNLAIGLIRLAGHTKIKEILERLHGNKLLILPLLAASRT